MKISSKRLGFLICCLVAISILLARGTTPESKIRRYLKPTHKAVSRNFPRRLIPLNDGIGDESVGDSIDVFKIIVIAGDNPQILHKVLTSITTTDYGGDKVELEVRISGSNPEQRVLSELIAQGFPQPAAVVHYTVVQSVGEGPGSEQSWRNAWLPGSTRRGVLIVDDSVELSPSWYLFVRQAWSEYMGRTDVAGISLTRQAVTTSVQLPLRMNPIVNDNEPYLHPLVVGPAAFSPHPDRWAEFLQWIDSVDLDKLRHDMPNFMTSLFQAKDHDEIFFYHTRKAAGTSIRRWLQTIAKEHGTIFHTKEGVVCPSKYFEDPDKDKHVDPMDPTWLYNDRVLSVTTLRDPVPRILSSYAFEGRWKATDNVRAPEDEVPFAAWMEKLMSPDSPCNKGHHCMGCVSECFHKWFGGGMSGDYSAERAVDVLNSFDVIIYTSDLNYPSFVRSMQRLFNATDIKFRNVNPTKAARKYDPTREETGLLEDLNREDTALVRNFTGGMRETLIAEDWFHMIDEQKLWTLWTQLFTYWCQLKGYSIMHVAPSTQSAMAVRHRSDISETDFSLHSEETFGKFVMPTHQHVKQYGMDGRLVSTVAPEVQL